MTYKRHTPIYLLALMLIFSVSLSASGNIATATPVIKRTATRTPTRIPTQTRTSTATVTATPTLSVTVTETMAHTAEPTRADVLTATPGNVTPYPSAPLCEDTGENHDNSLFHTLWDSSRGCHYNHEHGSNPYTQDVSEAFQGFDLRLLLGGVEIGHTNPSSPMENTHKHGGWKWDVELNIPCVAFESAQNCVTASVIQYHAFGDNSIEMESRIHSSVAMLKICNAAGCGDLFTVQHEDFGQMISGYQGAVLPFPNQPVPSYASNFGPYWSIDRWGDCVGCRLSPQYVRERNQNSNSVVTSKSTGSGTRPAGSGLFRFLWRTRDNYQLLRWDSVTDGYPFIFDWICGGSSYNPAGCRYNNTTTKPHEVAGVIPADWDMLDGVQDGRVTFEGFTTRFGVLAPSCTEAGGDCFPVKLVNVPVGSYGGALPGSKVSNPDKISNPSRNLFFCGLVVCKETDAGAVPSGWIGSEN